MKILEKINYLQNNNLGEWLKIRAVVDEEMSSNQSTFCLCGRLATSLHESSCRKFNGRVNSETVKRLSQLIVK